jgi:hypothetical protein
MAADPWLLLLLLPKIFPPSSSAFPQVAATKKELKIELFGVTSRQQQQQQPVHQS